MSVFKLDPDVYKRYKDQVLELCNSFQRIDRPGLSDKQIAERDCYPLDEWQRAIEFKRKAALEWAALALKRPDLKPE